MIVGFTERSRTVSESAVAPGDSQYRLDLELASLRVSERGYTIIIRHNERHSTAVVESLVLGENTFSDALFGVRGHSHDQLEDQVLLEPGQTTLQRVSASIIQDFRIELEECFTLQLYFSETPDAREPLVTCNAGNSSTNFFCEHTICIEDDDGKYNFRYHNVLVVKMQSYRTICGWICANNIHCSGECRLSGGLCPTHPSSDGYP